MIVIFPPEGSFVDVERIWRHIERIKEWYYIRDSSDRGGEREILKPLNKIIDFEHQELIFENSFYI